MKKTLLALFSLCSFGAVAQTVPNGDFELWFQDVTYEVPIGWTTSGERLSTLLGQPSNVFQDVDNNFTGDGGTSTPKLVTSQVAMGPVTFNVAGAISSGEIVYNNGTFSFIGGFDFTDRPGSLTGHYRYQPQGIDSCHIWVQLTRWNMATNSREIIASGSMWDNNTVNDYTYFEVPLSYTSNLPPDTALIVALSSKSVVFLTGTPGSTLWVDGLNFEYSAGVVTPSFTNADVYPNPADAMLKIAGTEQYVQARIYDLTGRLAQVVGVVNNTINIADLQSGQYIVELVNNGSSKARTTFTKN